MEYTKQQIFEMGKELFITFKGGVYASTIIAIGKAFGDEEPTVYGDGDNTINIVVSNEKYECMIGDIV